jgi:hypothetical protein
MNQMDHSSTIVTAIAIALLTLWFAIGLATATYDVTTGKKRPMKERLKLLFLCLPF